MNRETATAVATWTFLLHARGVPSDVLPVRRRCEALSELRDDTKVADAGNALIDEIVTLLDGEDGASIEAAARLLFGDRVATDLGAGSREERLVRLRRHQFAVGLPWMARLWELRPDGGVLPGWLVIDGVTDMVRALDPNPWNDIDEERRLPVGDFLVLWELGGNAAVYVARA